MIVNKTKQIIIIIVIIILIAHIVNLIMNIIIIKNKHVHYIVNIEIYDHILRCLTRSITTIGGAIAVSKLLE